MRNWADTSTRVPLAIKESSGEWLTALPVQQSDGVLLAVLCVRQKLAAAPARPSRHAAEVARILEPLLACAHRELAAAVPARQRMRALTERTAELEWLFKVTGKLKGAVDDRRIAEELLIAAADRLGSALAVLAIPERHLLITHNRDALNSEQLDGIWQQVERNLIHWAQRRKRPLIVNSAGRNGQKVTRCKILSVPVVRDTGRVLGVLAFFNPPDHPDFSTRHVFLARHLGRESASIVDAQFDLMTGLYTRGGLEQMYLGLCEDPDAPDRSAVYIDVDHMHVINELHGFELGNELIVRISEILAPPLLPDGALAARIAGDRFAVILPDSDAAAAAKSAEALLHAASRLVIGPADNPVEVSVSCGIASLVPMPQGLARSLAAAEVACKTAKGRGRNRVELYACEDGSMMRQHDDAIAVGQLRSALKNNRLILYAQRIAPLQNKSLVGGYEILLRFKGEDGEIIAPSPMLQAANRYQLLPSVDRWVLKTALRTLTPYRSMLSTRGLSISINMSGQTIDDENSIQHISEQLKSANLPAECVIMEITEQAAVRNLVRASELMRRLRALGCRFALDDFGTGVNSLAYLKSLQVSRLKIDGGFVQDILTNKNSEATVRAIVELAKGMAIDTVAEFVENEAIAEKVRGFGVDYAQGYAFGRPEPLDEVLRQLAEDESLRLHKLFLEI